MQQAVFYHGLQHQAEYLGVHHIVVHFIINNKAVPKAVVLHFHIFFKVVQLFPQADALLRVGQRILQDIRYIPHHRADAPIIVQLAGFHIQRLQGIVQKVGVDLQLQGGQLGVLLPQGQHGALVGEHPCLIASKLGVGRVELPAQLLELSRPGRSGQSLRA